MTNETAPSEAARNVIRQAYQNALARAKDISIADLAFKEMFTCNQHTPGAYECRMYYVKCGKAGLCEISELNKRQFNMHGNGENGEIGKEDWDGI